MEFSYRISEKDYVRAWKMVALSRKGPVIKTVLFWAFVVICLILLFAIIQKNNNRHNEARQDQVETEQTESAAPNTVSSSFENIAKNVSPLVLVVGIWIILIFYWAPQKVRRQYRKDTNCHGQMTIALEANSVDIRSSVGTSFQSGWNAFRDWSEKQDIVLLRYPSGTFQIINIVGLSDVERVELRGILAMALPKK